MKKYNATYFLKDGSQHSVEIADGEEFSTDSFKDITIFRLNTSTSQVFFTGDRLARIEVAF